LLVSCGIWRVPHRGVSALLLEEDSEAVQRDAEADD
jgi:hypothetical protein